MKHLLLLLINLLVLSLTSQYHDADVFHHVFEKNKLQDLKNGIYCIDSSWIVEFSDKEKEDLINYLFEKTKDTCLFFYNSPIYKSYEFTNNNNYELSNFGLVSFMSEQNINASRDFRGNQLHLNYSKVRFDSLAGELIYQDSIVESTIDKKTGIGIGTFETWNLHKGDFIKNTNYSSMYLETRGFEKERSFYLLSSKKNKPKKKGKVFKKNVVYDFVSHEIYRFDTARYKLACEFETDFKRGEFSTLISKVLDLIDKDSFDLFDNENKYAITVREAQSIMNSFFEVKRGLRGIPIKSQWEIQGEFIYYVEKNYTGFRFIEDWYFDANNFSIIKKVKGLQLLSFDTNYYAENVEVIKAIPLYISFDGKPAPEGLFK